MHKCGAIIKNAKKQITANAAPIKPNNAFNIKPPINYNTISYYIHDSTMKTKRKALAVKPGPIATFL